MQVTKRQEANYTERQRGEAQVNPEGGVSTEDWHIMSESGNRMGW